MTDDVEHAVDLLAESEHLVGFTGAGVSTESGIPDFRSPGGLWERYDPSDFTIQALRRDPVGYWEKRLEMREERELDWSTIEPNPAHHALSTLEREGPLKTLVTQNVDGLHQTSGSDRVLELHGTRTEAKCLNCGRRLPLDTLERKLEEEALPPRCEECDGLLKRATVSFGEALPQQVLQEAREAATDCDCFLVAGSSLTVQPAASLPRLALQSGADLVIVNLEETAMDASAGAVIHGKAGETLPPIVERALDVEVSREGGDSAWEPGEA